MTKVVLSTSLIIGTGLFEAEKITKKQALEWMAEGSIENFSGHETVRILGLQPDKSRLTCAGYDQALTIKPLARLEFGREYSVAEIEAIGVEFVLIRRVRNVSS